MGISVNYTALLILKLNVNIAPVLRSEDGGVMLLMTLAMNSLFYFTFIIFFYTLIGEINYSKMKGRTVLNYLGS